jgi:hypothetical protein
LVVGDRVGADAAAVEQRQRRIAELDKEMNKLSERIEQAKTNPMLGASGGFAAIARKKLEGERIEQVRALQSILESTRQEAAAEANPATRAAAAADRVKAVLSQPVAGGWARWVRRCRARCSHRSRPSSRPWPPDPLQSSRRAGSGRRIWTGS